MKALFSLATSIYNLPLASQTSHAVIKKVKRVQFQTNNRTNVITLLPKLSGSTGLTKLFTRKSGWQDIIIAKLRYVQIEIMIFQFSDIGDGEVSLNGHSKWYLGTLSLKPCQGQEPRVGHNWWWYKHKRYGYPPRRDLFKLWRISIF